MIGAEDYQNQPTEVTFLGEWGGGVWFPKVVAGLVKVIAALKFKTRTWN